MNKVYKDPKIKISKSDFEKPDEFDDSKVDCHENYGVVEREVDSTNVDSNEDLTPDIDPELNL
jgi:hypothetical protein